MQKLLYSLEELKKFHRNEVINGIYGGRFELWLNTSNYYHVTDNMYKLCDTNRDSYITRNKRVNQILNLK